MRPHRPLRLPRRPIHQTAERRVDPADYYTDAIETKSTRFQTGTSFA
jgi:hypothetical protein